MSYVHRRVFTVSILFCVSAFADEPKTLDDMIDERIKKNIEYRDEFSEDAKSSPIADQLVPVEKQVGQKWVDLLKYARASQDIAFKAHVLRLDYCEEIRSSCYELEYAEGLLEKTKYNLEMSYWRTRLKLVDEFEKAELADSEKKQSGKDRQLPAAAADEKR